MKRLLVAGLVAAAAYGLYRVAKAYAGDAGIVETARQFVDEARDAMTDRETELMAALGMADEVDAVGEPMDPARARALFDDPAGVRAFEGPVR